ncbi:hypothetical protein GCM10027020_36360 [Nocardioides salsibiostraticola]
MARGDRGDTYEGESQGADKGSARENAHSGTVGARVRDRQGSRPAATCVVVEIRPENNHNVGGDRNPPTNYPNGWGLRG